MRDNIHTQELLTCPVCGKEFKPNDDTKYIASGGYTCSWKCFLVVAKKNSGEKNVNNSAKKKQRNNKT